MMFKQQNQTNFSISELNRQKYSSNLKKEQQNMKNISGKEQNIKSPYLEIQKEFDDDYEVDSDDSEVSLEEDILYHHKDALQMLLTKKYIQQGLIHAFIDNNRFTLESSKLTELPINFRQHLSTLLSTYAVSKPLFLHFFNLTLEKKPHFKNFLMHLHYTYPSRLSEQLIKWVFIIFQIYFPFIQAHLSYQNIEEQASRIGSHLYFQEISKKSKAIGNEPTMNAQNEIIQFKTSYCLTILLILESYFTNPILDENKTLRQSEPKIEKDAEWSQTEQIRKKIKVDAVM